MNKGTLAKKVGLGAIAALTAFAGLAPFATGAGAASNYSQVRYDGEDRFETAALIAAAIAEATPTAVIARADIYPDALTGAFAAAANGDGPMLLTRSDSVPQTTLDALEAEGVDNVILLGGPAAIDEDVADELEAEGYAVDRIFGATRYQTAIEIAEDGAGIIGTIDGDRTAILSSGENFPDALSGAPLSFAAGLPSLLTPSDLDGPAAEVGFFNDTVDALAGLNIDQVLILGGPAAVSEDIEEALNNEGFNVSRIHGGDRHSTSVEVFEFGLDKGIYTNRRFGIARSDTFPDALAYAPLAGRPRTAPAPASGVADTGGSANGLLLTPSCDVHSSVEEFILENQATWTQGEILGGESAICEDVADEIEELASVGRSNVNVTSGDVAPGGTITGTITGENIAAVTVSGCGFTNEPVTRDAEGDFTLTLSNTQTTDCTLTFTTTFTDGSTETDTVPVNVVAPGDPQVALNPTGGASGTQSTATYSGNRPADITNVSTNTAGCTVTNQGTQTNNRTFTVSGPAGTVCNIQTTVTYTDAAGGTETFNDSFTVSGGTTPPPGGGSTAGVGAGPQLRTAGPDLLSATIINGVPNDATPNQVRYTFDEAVLGPVFADFSLLGPDSADAAALFGTSASIDSNDPNSVIVQFPEANDLRPFTIATADDNAVTDGANGSVLASKPLGGSTASTASGRTAGPDLISTTINTTAQEVTYCFDQPIVLVDFTQLGYYTDSGQINTATGATPLTGTQSCVVAQFAGAPNPVETADRFFAGDPSLAVGDGAVTDINGAVDNPIGHEPQTATTVRPDLTSATKVAGQPSQIDYVFDEAVNVAGGFTATSFAAYQDDGTRFDATTVAQNGPNTVRATFAGINQNNVGQIVLAGVEDSAIFSASAAAEGNTWGDAPLTGGANTGAGFTDGPDLMGATFNTTANQVTYTFDEPVEDAGAFPVDETAFFVVDAAGIETPGLAGTATISGNTVTVTFAGGVASAAGAGVNTTHANEDGATAGDAAFDFLGNENSPDSVGGGPAPAA